RLPTTDPCHGRLRFCRRAVRRRLPRGLERDHQARARSVGDDGPDLDRRGSRRRPVRAGGRPAGRRGMAGGARPGADPSRLLRGADRKLPRWRHGQVYPIARGSAPLMTAIATTALVGERLGLYGWCGIALLVAGVLLLSLRGGRELAQLDRRAGGFAPLPPLPICALSVVDGVGPRPARHST